MMDEITRLREQVAALTQKLENMTGANMLNANALRLNKEKLTAAQATNERLREALNMVLPYAKKIEYAVDGLPDPIIAAIAILALPNDTTALDSRLKEERERCAKVCDKYKRGIMDLVNVQELTHIIRSMT